MEHDIAEGTTARREISPFATVEGFEMLQRVGKMFSTATIVPKDYQNNLGNCMIAIEMANRLSINPMMVMQNLYIVNGRPAWSSQYIIAMINQSQRYKTPLQFEVGGKGDSLSCYAWAEDHNGHKDVGPTITMGMAKAEGWIDRTGSKWKTMPEVMMRYRAASFFGRLYCSDMLMGIYSREEVVEGIHMGDGDYVITPNAEDVRIDDTAAPKVDATPQDPNPRGETTQTEEPDF